MPRILWADDEIDLLKPHVLFLETKGFDVETVTNGADAVDRSERERFDVVFLDEQMPGLGGLDALERIKERRPEVPVVMITKSEEEHLMEDAIGRQIADYLIKPVHPKQILLTCKRLLEGDRIRGEQVQQDYLQAFGQLSARLGGPLDYTEWIDVYRQLVRFDLELQGADEGVRQILDDQYRGANEAFSRFIEDEYPAWIAASQEGEKPGETRPAMSHDIIGHSVMPHLGGLTTEQARPVVFFLIDCLRYDQWLLFERTLQQAWEIETDWHYSILPTATPYSRNAIFGGLLPIDLAKRFPQRFTADVRDDDEPSLNAHEEDFLRDLLDRRHRKDVRMRYEKLVSQSDGAAFADRVTDLLQVDLSAVIVNFVDILAHSRSDTRILREIVAGIRADDNAIDLGVRVSAFDLVPHRPDAAQSRPGKPGPGIPEEFETPYPFQFSINHDDPTQIDLSETFQFVDLCGQLGVKLLNISAGSPYYNPHCQRPAAYPPSDGYQPAHDPLIDVARLLDAARQLRDKLPAGM
ncbi:MAG TPA: response regulator, partial [Bacteroidetes bacterium]|nr:response regulator [Bacteroidota bacterium]